MTISIAKIQCVNKRCRKLNLLGDALCNECQTPIVKRYLRIGGNIDKEYSVGELINDRFFVCQPSIVIDTKPDISPIFPENVPETITPYLKLFSHRLHVPQIYGFLDNTFEQWLLEYESIPLDEKGNLIHPELFPSLELSLFQVSALRQISWLWQIILLWNPLEKQKVLSSLFYPHNLRVGGGIIKLRELIPDNESKPTLKDLGNLWENWITRFNPLIKEILEKIVLSLQENLLETPNQVLDILDQVLYILGNNYYQRKFKLITATDAGKKRKNNEDSCYPSVDSLKEINSGIDTLTIVCDGLGGQEKGEIASHLAIEIMQKQLEEDYKKTLKETLNNKHWTPLIDSKKILKAISKANDIITTINNKEKRKDRERMGTTVVMSMAIAHEVYFAYVGDSRIYWITKDSCHQVTVDDDLATREVRLGYGFYRQLINNPQTGALLQALGMESSRKLKVHIRRFVLDEDSVFLLCSDGLSDFDRVEQYWKTEILPIIQEEIDIEEGIKKILDMGLRKNGHDNITISLLQCKIEQKTPEDYEGKLTWQYLQEIIPNLPQPKGQLTPHNKAKSLFDSIELPLSKPTLIIIISVIVVIIGLILVHQNKSSQNKSLNSPSRQLITVL
ncbi:PP2C family protein-serine/threonine phosphatase [Geminocystis sp. CENA526]|uniref:PP2C family protein-serine/threonine phosphatase n=1 Tax=Geminocystis sp. CENA526 TaxID=1355871 RepID=UPI003D6F74DE